ncbi:MAG: alginate lyase family protein [Saprospiraceae bacterium]|nr:alginate lyase family protein [Saprospiraceae bacterium]
MYTLSPYYLLFLFCLSICYNCKVQEGKRDQIKIPQSAKKDLSVIDLDQFLYVKQNLDSDLFSSEYEELINEADEALKNGPYSVVNKTKIPPSGDKHDYISLGPYWWPDPDKPDGLPWIRRDGEVNPLTRGENTDIEIKGQMFRDASSSGLAYFFSDDKKYRDKALQLLEVWFLNPETKMNPNLNFAQGIPGRSTGRCFGIIEFTGITNIITTIEVLELKNSMPIETSQGLRSWFSDYLNWLQTSEYGVLEKTRKNNHATWYDVQVASILLYLDRNDEAKQVLEDVKTGRIATQIEPNGEQPHEMARTKTLSYSTMNLRGFTQLAFLGTKVDVDLWNYKTQNGAGIISAFEFLKPYASGAEKWNYEQISSLENARKGLKQLFIRAGSQFNVPDYCKVGSIEGEKANSLLYFCR